MRIRLCKHAEDRRASGNPPICVAGHGRVREIWVVDPVDECRALTDFGDRIFRERWLVDPEGGGH
jgi:hypothetical protein